MTIRSFAIPSLALLSLTAPLFAEGWWNKEWTQRQKLTIDAGANAANLSEAVENATVLVRLHDGNFKFFAASTDGSDLRFVAEDGTLLPHQVEKFDALVNEAFVWVKVPKISGGGKTTISLYYGNANPASVPALKASDVYDASLVYHFAERGGSPVDVTSHANNGTGAVTTSEGSIIGSGARLLGGDPLSVAPSPSLETNGGFTWSAWIKSTGLQDNAVILSQGEGGASLRLLVHQGAPFVEVTSGGNTQRTPAGAPIAIGTWAHVAVVAESNRTSLYVNGEPLSQLQATLPTLTGPLLVGGAAANSNPAGLARFVGEVDELSVAKGARAASSIRFSALSQGTSDVAQRTVSLREIEGGEGGGGGSKALEHVMLFGDIAKNMMFDGWIAIGVCVIMIVVGWSVAVRKFLYLNSIQKSSQEFLRQWKQLSSDLTAIDHSSESSIGSFGGIADAKSLALVKGSPLYQIYHIGSEEIRHRLARDKQRTQGLSGRSIQAIRAALDGGLVHETHRLTKGLVYLTISIAGGPYVGLLGTVVGVMITFAIIAKSGEVDVNSIAPGIASALLATVAGLVVAIPALFIYSYLNSRIKETTSGMQVFIDEFVAKMAEFYPPAGEVSPYAPASHHQGASPSKSHAAPVAAGQD